MTTQILGSSRASDAPNQAIPDYVFTHKEVLDPSDQRWLGNYVLRKVLHVEVPDDFYERLKWEDAAITAVDAVIHDGGSPFTDDREKVRAAFRHIVSDGEYHAGVVGSPSRARPDARRMPERDLSPEQVLAIYLCGDRANMTLSERQGILDAWKNLYGKNRPRDDADRQRRRRGRQALRQLKGWQLMDVIAELRRRDTEADNFKKMYAALEEGLRRFDPRAAEEIADQAAAYLEALDAEPNIEDLFNNGFEPEPTHVPQRLSFTREQVRIARERQHG